MEGLLTNYYEYHFLYIGGIHHVESRNIQGMALMKLYFHPGTNMVTTYYGFTWWDNEVDGEKMYPAKQHNPSEADKHGA